MPYNSQWTGPQIDEAIGEVRRKGPDWDAKQNEVIGGITQIAGFNMMGELVAKSPSDIPDIATKEYVQQVAGSGSGGTGGGAGLPTGGATGQMLVKSSYENYDTEWADPPSVPTKVSDLDNDSGFVTGTQVDNKINQALDDVGASGGLPTGGIVGQYLVKKSTAAYDAEWKDIPDFVTQDELDTALDGLSFDDGLPTGGTTGQVLTKKSGTDYDAEWKDPTGGVETFNGRTGNVVPLAGDYTASMVGALPATTVIPTKVSQLTNDSSYARIWRTTVTLNASDWDTSTKAQTVTINGIKADESAQLIQPVPSKASYELYANAEIRVTQSANILTFTAEEIPTETILCYIVVTELDSTSSVPPVSGGDGGTGSGGDNSGDNGNNLPSDYQETQYIALSEGAGIYLKDVNINTLTTKIEADIMPLEYGDEEKYIFLSWYMNGSTIAYYFLDRFNSSSIRYCCGTGASTESNIFNYTGAGEVTYRLELKRVYISIDPQNRALKIGNSNFTMEQSPNVDVGAYGIFIGSVIGGGSNIPGVPMNIYSCKIYNNNVLVGDYVPCKDSSGVAGLYDKVQEKFLKANSGTITAGPDVTEVSA